MSVLELKREIVFFAVVFVTGSDLMAKEAAGQLMSPPTNQPNLQQLGAAESYGDDTGKVLKFIGPFLKPTDPTDEQLRQTFRHHDHLIYKKNPCQNYNEKSTSKTNNRRTKGCVKAAMHMYHALKKQPSIKCGTVVDGQCFQVPNHDGRCYGVSILGPNIRQTFILLQEC